MPQFSSFSLMFAVLVAALLVALNSRESTTVSEPFYAPMLGAAWHPPPYAIKEMAIDVRYDRGWPIWHTRRSQSFAAHNFSRHVMSEKRPQDGQPGTADIGFDIVFDSGTESMHAESSPTNWARAGFDALVTLSIVAFNLMLGELTSRRIRGEDERSTFVDNTPTTM